MLIDSMPKFLSIEINEIIGRIGTNEPPLTEVIMSRTNQELHDVSNFYLTCIHNHFLKRFKCYIQFFSVG